MTFKEKIVKLRKMKGLTQDEFASAVGVSRQAVYKWECGQSYPEVAKLIEIKMLLGISIDDLLDESYEVIVPEKKRKKRISKAEQAAIEANVAREEDEGTKFIAATVLESAPAVPEAPAAKAEPAAAPVVKETLVAVAVEETPVAPKTPVVEEAPVAPEAPVVEETPVAENAPVETAEEENKGKKKSLEDSFLDRLSPEKRSLFSRLFNKK